MSLPPERLLEVVLPLEAINTASAREKSIRHGYPSTLHLWWRARRPLATARAIVLAQMVDAPPPCEPNLFPTGWKDWGRDSGGAGCPGAIPRHVSAEAPRGLRTKQPRT
jgi:adenine-specific DNA methylase